MKKIPVSFLPILDFFIFYITAFGFYLKAGESSPTFIFP